MVSNGMWEHSVPRKEKSSLLVTYMNGMIKHSKNRKKNYVDKNWSDKVHSKYVVRPQSRKALGLYQLSNFKTI